MKFAFLLNICAVFVFCSCMDQQRNVANLDDYEDGQRMQLQGARPISARHAYHSHFPPWFSNDDYDDTDEEQTDFPHRLPTKLIDLLNQKLRLKTIGRQLYSSDALRHSFGDFKSSHIPAQLPITLDTALTYEPTNKQASPLYKTSHDIWTESLPAQTFRVDSAQATAELTSQNSDELENQLAIQARLQHAQLVESNTKFAYSPKDPEFHSNFRIPEINSIPPPPRVTKLPNPILSEHHLESPNLLDELHITTTKSHNNTGSISVYLIAAISGICAAIAVGILAVGVGWYNYRRNKKTALDSDYPAYGVTGPNKDTSPSTGDRRLAQSAQIYHYQLQKQQVISMERNSTTDRNGSVSEVESEDDNDEADYTVYECPGLAPTDGEMEVKNPMYKHDSTLISKAQDKNIADEK